MKFRAWYSGGREYRGETSKAWARLPKRGVLVVVRYRDEEYQPGLPYRDLYNSGDWYWPGGRTPEHETLGEWADPPAGVKPEMLKRGEMVDDDEMAEAVAAAVAAKVW